jgi:DNA-binding CsgD family transcriptional regulator
MPRLSTADYESVLDVRREAAAVEEPNPFPKPVLDALRRLVPCDVVAYHERSLRQPGVVWTGEPRGQMTQEIRSASRRHWHQDQLAPADGARKVSDFLSQREFHRLELYQDGCRPLGVEYMRRLWLDPRGDRGARLEFDRAEADFVERDRSVLDLLLPHLEQFRRTAIARRRWPSPPVNRVDDVTPRERDVLELVAQGKTNAEVARVLWISPGTVRKHLENAYEKLGVGTRTGAVAALFSVGPDVLEQ